jgi:DTW domain-containing protein YfiP
MLCACESASRVELRTPVVVVQHNKDCRKPTNTVRILTTCLPNCVVTRYAVRGAEFDSSALESPGEIDWCLLFPRTDDPEATDVSEQLEVDEFRRGSGSGRRRGIVVVDGTWAQARRMRRRLDALRSLPIFELPAGPPTRWTVRTQSDRARMSTAEATIRALAICEGAVALRPVKRYFNLVSARMMFMKSALPTPDVPREWGEDVVFDDASILAADVLSV